MPFTGFEIIVLKALIWGSVIGGVVGLLVLLAATIWNIFNNPY